VRRRSAEKGKIGQALECRTIGGEARGRHRSEIEFHLLIAVAEFVSIIGIPFALKDLQLARLALAPVGKMVVDKS